MLKIVLTVILIIISGMMWGVISAIYWDTLGNANFLRSILTSVAFAITMLIGMVAGFLITAKIIGIKLC